MNLFHLNICSGQVVILAILHFNEFLEKSYNHTINARPKFPFIKVKQTKNILINQLQTTNSLLYLAIDKWK